MVLSATTARLDVLKYAQAETKKAQLRGEIDSRISGIGSFTLGRGRLFGYESDDSFASRISSSEPVKAILQKAFMEKTTKEEALSHFSNLLKQTLHTTLASSLSDEEDRAKKVEGIAKAVVRQLAESALAENFHILGRATTEALAYQTGYIESVYSAPTRGLFSLAAERGVTTDNAETARQVVMDSFLPDIRALNAQKALRAKENASDELSRLTTSILKHVHSREVRSSSKTSKEIAKQILSSASSTHDTFTPTTLKHPLNALWVGMSKASATPVSFGQLRASFVSKLALSLHHEKHYDAHESIRKAEHIFNYLCEGLDRDAVELYAQTYRSCLPVDNLQIDLLSKEGDLRAYSGPVFEHAATSEEVARHSSFLLTQKAASIATASGDIERRIRDDADRESIVTGRTSADSFIRQMAERKDLMLHFYKRALFESGKESLSDEEKLASYRDQVSQYLGDKLDALTGRTPKATWIEQAAKKIASELDRLYSSELVVLEKERLGLGPRHSSPAEMDETLFKFTEYEARASARSRFNELLGNWCQQIREKVDLRPSSPDIRQIEAAFNPAIMREMATSFFVSAPQDVSVADFQIALSTALISALSGTAGMDEHLHSTAEAREKLRTWSAQVMDRFLALADTSQILSQVLARREALGLSREEDESVESYIAYREARLGS